MPDRRLRVLIHRDVGVLGLIAFIAFQGSPPPHSPKNLSARREATAPAPAPATMMARGSSSIAVGSRESRSSDSAPPYHDFDIILAPFLPRSLPPTPPPPCTNAGSVLPCSMFRVDQSDGVCDVVSKLGL